MKIAVMGTSGSGKSTLAQRLGDAYGAAVLHMDAVHFLPGWRERPLAEEIALTDAFMDAHDAWVIDGNYTKTCLARRLTEADEIVVLNFNRFLCLWRVIQRWRENRGRVRASAAAGCEEKLDAEFIWWVLYEGRRPERLAVYEEIRRQYPQKFILLKNSREVDAYCGKLQSAKENQTMQ